MAKLTDDVKLHIVRALACFDTPSQVVESVKEDFGVEITRMQAQSYDPTKKMGEDLSKKWTAIFKATRKKFLEDTASIPIANRAYRLRVINRLLTKAETSRNAVLALNALEQAAKESGDFYVNRKQEQPGAGGAPPVPAPDYKLLRPDEDAPKKPIL